MSPCPFTTTITITPQAPLKYSYDDDCYAKCINVFFLYVAIQINCTRDNVLNYLFEAGFLSKEWKYFCLLGFYGISAIVGYSMPMKITFLNEIESFFLYRVKWFQVLLYNSHNFKFARIVCSIWLIKRTLSGANHSGQSEPVSNSNEGVLHIQLIYKAWATLWDGLMSCLGH